MKENDVVKLKEADLVKQICVLSGELLECYQWQEEKIDSDTAFSIVENMKKNLELLEHQIKSAKR